MEVNDLREVLENSMVCVQAWVDISFIASWLKNDLLANGPTPTTSM